MSESLVELRELRKSHKRRLLAELAREDWDLVIDLAAVIRSMDVQIRDLESIEPPFDG